MLNFKAEDGYSYHINVIDEFGYDRRSFRVDSGELNLQLATNEYIVIKRLDISPQTSIKLKELHSGICSFSKDTALV